MSETRKGGRPKGSVNKATAAVRAIAQQYTEEAVLTLAEIMRDGTNSERIAAADKLLDRAHGKPAQMVGQEPDQKFKVEFSWLT